MNGRIVDHPKYAIVALRYAHEGVHEPRFGRIHFPPIRLGQRTLDPRDLDLSPERRRFGVTRKLVDPIHFRNNAALPRVLTGDLNYLRKLLLRVVALVAACATTTSAWKALEAKALYTPRPSE